MPTRDDYLAALRRAAAANDYDAANELADYIHDNFPTAEQLRQEDWDRMSAGEQALVGAGEALTKTFAGISDLLPSVRYKGESVMPTIRVAGQEQSVDKAREDLALSGQVDSAAKTAGSIGADVAMLAVPGAAAARGASLPLALAREAALSGAYEGAKLPGEGESRTGNAVTAAGATVVGGAALPVVAAGMRRMLPIKEEARELLEQGVRLTPGQAIDRSSVGGLEKAMGYIPGLAGGVRQRQREALQDWNRYVQGAVDPNRADVLPEGLGGLGHEGFQALQDSFKRAYNDVWQDVDPSTVRLKGLADDWTKLGDDIDLVPDDLKGYALETLSKAKEGVVKFSRTGDTGQLEYVDDLLRNAEYGVDDVHRPWFSKVRNSFKSSLPEGVPERLAAVDKDYANYKVVERAGSYKAALENEGVFTPSNLMGAVKAQNSNRALATNSGRLQNEALTGTKTIDSLVPQEGFGSVAGGSTVPLALGLAAAGQAPIAAGAGAARMALLGPVARDVITGRRAVPGDMTKPYQARMADFIRGTAGPRGAALTGLAAGQIPEGSVFDEEIDRWLREMGL